MYLLHFSHLPPACPEHSPHAWQKPKICSQSPVCQTTLFLDAANTKHIQEVVGILLYYACAMDSTLLTALGTIAIQQAKGTQATMEAITQSLNYCATHLDATVCYHASGMVLQIHSNTSYLNAPKGCLQAARYHFLSAKPPSAPSAAANPPPTMAPLTCYVRS